jgi:hypothetical protein
MRAWLLTWTTYGTWLPGNKRGSVTRGRPYDGALPALETASQAALKGPPIFLTLPQAERTPRSFAKRPPIAAGADLHRR